MCWHDIVKTYYSSQDGWQYQRVEAEEEAQLETSYPSLNQTPLMGLRGPFNDLASHALVPLHLIRNK